MYVYTFPEINPTIMDHQTGGAAVTKPAAVTACISMAVFYVAILYTPTLILRFPPPISMKSFMIRRFVCAAVCSVVSLVVCSLILPIRMWDASNVFGVYGLRLDHVWQALVFPLALTSLMYSGSIVLNILSMLQSTDEDLDGGGNLSCTSIKSAFLQFIDWVVSTTSNVTCWRNYFVAPLTEELVFRACMIPLLLCAGFNTYTVIFLCPIFFSLAHLNHLFELYTQQNLSLLRACTVVGFQLGYTVIFGAYASFLLVRTGHLTGPLIAHIFCNFMGLPALFSRRSAIVSVAFAMGVLGFVWLLFPLTSPHLYNDRTDNCQCWHRYCNWN